MISFIDTHCHLYDEAFDSDRDEAMQRAVDAGISIMIQPAIDSSTTTAQASLTGSHILHMAGLHPTSVGENYKEELEHVTQLLAAGPGHYVAIGEIGLDYYWDTTYREQQIEVLREQMLLAKHYGLPVALHVRKAYDDLFLLMKSMGYSQWEGVMHCFSGSRAHALKALDLGFYLGIGGVVTFKNSSMADIVERTPLDRIVLETDAPYLAPVPYRGKRNESAYIPIIAQKIADIKHLSLAEVAAATTQNACRLFNLSLF